MDNKIAINIQEEASFLQSSNQDNMYLDPPDVEEINNGTDGERAIEVQKVVVN